MVIISIIRLILFIPAILLSGYAIQTLWHWFIVPLGMVELSLAHGLGISSLVTYFTFQLNVRELIDNENLPDKKKLEIAIWDTVFWFAKPLFVLSFGRVYSQFI